MERRKGKRETGKKDGRKEGGTHLEKKQIHKRLILLYLIAFLSVYFFYSS